MVKAEVILCDICDKKTAKTAITKCFLCGRDICENHNFGGENARVRVRAEVFNDHVFEISYSLPILDLCSFCTDKLHDIKIKCNETFKQILIDSATEIQIKVLELIQRNIPTDKPTGDNK